MSESQFENPNFQYCCDNCHMQSYNIIHEPIPIGLFLDRKEQNQKEKLNPEQIEEFASLNIMLQRLLWYIPNLKNSIQSTIKLEIIDNEIFDDFCFDFILKQMNMTRSDVNWTNGSDIKDIVENKEYNYEALVCTNCQKIIFQRNPKETLTTNLLRHLRNACAHGNFTLIRTNTGKKMFVGKDIYDKKKTAFIKIFPDELLKALELLESVDKETREPQFKEMLLQYAMENCGYEIIQQTGLNKRCDILAQKNGKLFAFEIKSCKNFTKVQLDREISFINEYRHETKFEGTAVLLCDTPNLNPEFKDILKQQNIVLLDQSNLKSFLEGIDVLEHGEL